MDSDIPESFPEWDARGIIINYYLLSAGWDVDYVYFLEDVGHCNLSF